MGPKHGLREEGGCGCGAAWPVPPVRRRCVPVVMCPARAAVEHQDGVHYGCPECSVLQPGRPSAQGTSKSIHGAGRAPALAGLQKDEVLIRAEAWSPPQAPGTACVHHYSQRPIPPGSRVHPLYPPIQPPKDPWHLAHSRTTGWFPGGNHRYSRVVLRVGRRREMVKR